MVNFHAQKMSQRPNKHPSTNKEQFSNQGTPLSLHILLMYSYQAFSSQLPQGCIFGGGLGV